MCSLAVCCTQYSAHGYWLHHPKHCWVLSCEERFVESKYQVSIVFLDILFTARRCHTGIQVAVTGSDKNSATFASGAQLQKISGLSLSNLYKNTVRSSLSDCCLELPLIIRIAGNNSQTSHVSPYRVTSKLPNDFQTIEPFRFDMRCLMLGLMRVQATCSSAP